MAGKARVNYVRGVVICHGKSELQLARYVNTNLHLNIKPYARDKGKTSIQITSLMDVLNSTQFGRIDPFLEAYPVEIAGKGKRRKLVRFRLFVMMDTDDCKEQQKKDFISGRMFSEHWAAEYITPIYAVPSLEAVMRECGILTHRISSGDKGEYYTKVFPINQKPLSLDTKKEVETLYEKTKPCLSTNMELFLEYCLSLCTL